MYAIHLFLRDLHDLALAEIGQIGVRRCTEIRCKRGNRNAIISFELRGAERPFRIGLYHCTPHTFDEFSIVEWHSITDSRPILGYVTENLEVPSHA